MKPTLEDYEHAGKQMIEAFRYLDNARLTGDTENCEKCNEQIIKELVNIKLTWINLVQCKLNDYPQLRPFDPMKIRGVEK